jgi:hypothetical protein
MDSLAHAGLMNIWVTAAASIGLIFLTFLLNKKVSESDRFLFRGLVTWCCSWIVWTAAWLIVVYFKPSSENLKAIITLSFNDLKTILQLILYFTLFRGSSFSLKSAGLYGVGLVIILAVGYGTVHLVFSAPLANHLHEQWSMCLSVVAPILIGWAIRVRFGGYFALVIGYAYGFAQPAAFAASYHGSAYPTDQSMLADGHILLALMKVVWVSVVTRYFFSDPATVASPVLTSPISSEISFFKGAPKAFYILPAGLIVSALSIYFILKPVSLGKFISILTLVAMLVTLFKNGLDLLDRFRKSSSGAAKGAGGGAG